MAQITTALDRRVYVWELEIYRDKLDILFPIVQGAPQGPSRLVVPGVSGMMGKGAGQGVRLL